MSAPRAVIVLELEASPQLHLDCLSESEERRLCDWLAARPELRELLTRATEIIEERRAA